MSKFTPGPWSVSEVYGGAAADVNGADGFPVAETVDTAILNGWSDQFPRLKHWSSGKGKAYIERSDEECAANARLIAAAPTAYDLIRDVAAHFADTDAPLGLRAAAWLKSVESAS